MRTLFDFPTFVQGILEVFVCKIRLTPYAARASEGAGESPQRQCSRFLQHKNPEIKHFRVSARL